MITEEKVIEAAEAVQEDIVEAVSRNPLPFALGGFVFGAVVSAGVTFFFTRRHLDTKYNEIAQEEIEAMRDHYHSKTVALESRVRKEVMTEDLDKIVVEQGYSEKPGDISDGPPMAVQPPDVDIVEPTQVRNIFRDRPEPPVEEFVWSFAEEHKRRDPNLPYVIHYDEIHEMDYQQVELTYYDGDGVLCNDRDEIFDPEDLDRVIGEKNLDRFGHGSNDPLVVYIRNDNLELIYEISKTDQSYAEAVHGFTKESWEPKNRLRERQRERDEQDGS